MSLLEVEISRVVSVHALELLSLVSIILEAAITFLPQVLIFLVLVSSKIAFTST